MLGAFRHYEAASRLAGHFSFCGALALTVAFQRWQYALRDDQTAWWASNGRDLINSCCWAALFLSLYLVGFPGPSALLLAATLLLVLNLLEGAILAWPKAPFPTALSLLVALSLGVPIILAPRDVHRFLNTLAEALR